MPCTFSAGCLAAKGAKYHVRNVKQIKKNLNRSAEQTFRSYKEAGVATCALTGEPLTYNKPVLKHQNGFISAASQTLLDQLLQHLNSAEG